MLNIVLSNRYEILREHLLAHLAGPVENPLQAEQVIVPSLALRRDLTLAVARRHGVCANIEFGFLAQWIWRQVAKVIPTVASESPFASPVLAWRVLGVLHDARFIAEHPRLASYLARADGVMRLELARQIAGIFEQYLTYRPDWMADWAATRSVSFSSETQMHDERWQAALWRRLLADLGLQGEHPAFEFSRRLGSQGNIASRLGMPATIHMFCLPSIPPLYLQIISKLGQTLDIQLYLLNPCQEYWFHIVERRRLGYLTARGEDAGHETGNRLLADWGQQTRTCIEQVLAIDDQALIDDAGFVPTAGNGLLACLQNAVLALREPLHGEVSLEHDDHSLEVHVCHSLTRQLEVLHDRLLSLFAADPELTPDQVLVVVPDLETAAPLIDAVFGTVPYERRIPYSITGRGRSAANPVATALLALIALGRSRFAASDVFALLQLTLVQRRFGIAIDQLETIRHWLKTAGIRWAVDAVHRVECGVPALERFSFDDGMQRLFMAYALPDGVEDHWHGRATDIGIEGADAVLLGRFNEFLRRLIALRAQLAEPAPVAGWTMRLRDATDAFLAPEDDEADDLEELRAAINSMRDAAVQAEFAAPVDIELVSNALEGLLDDATRGGTPTGDVTFAALPSLRGIAYRVICAIGLDDGVFPSSTRAVEFDLMAAKPRPGDRQRRVDERNLFLDLLLAARERLILTYCGRNVRDNSELPPSVLVADLLEVAMTALDAEPAEARAHLVVEHPLQCHSPRYFLPSAEPRIASYNASLCEALRTAVAQPAKANDAPLVSDPEVDALEADSDDELDEGIDNLARPGFFTAPLEPLAPEWHSVSLAQLIRFFGNPCRYLLRERLGIHFDREDEEIVDAEPFVADYRATQQLAARLLPAIRDGMTHDTLRSLALAGCEYPPGQLGAAQIDAEINDLRQFSARVRRAEGSATLPPWSATLAIAMGSESWQLSGVLAAPYASGLVFSRYDTLRPRHRLDAWLYHLFLCATAPSGIEQRTQWLARDLDLQFLPCIEAKAELARLLALYRQGLSAPLLFFPKAAWAFAAKDSLYAATNAWQTTQPGLTPESADAAYRLALRGLPDVLGDAFRNHAKAVFGPMLAHAREVVP